MGRSKDGALLVEARKVLDDLYVKCLKDGFHGRCNGSRAKKHPSPIPGSNIILATRQEVVVVYQTECGRGPIEVRVYSATSGDDCPMYREVVKRLEAAGLYKLSPPS